MSDPTKAFVVRRVKRGYEMRFARQEEWDERLVPLPPGPLDESIHYIEPEGGGPLVEYHDLETPADGRTVYEIFASDDDCICGAWVGNPNPDCERCQLVAEIGRLKAEARRFHHADGSYELLDSAEEVVRRRIEAAKRIEARPTEVELFEVGAVALTCLDTVACDLADDDLCDYIAEIASRLETVLRKLGWEPKQGEAK